METITITTKDAQFEIFSNLNDFYKELNMSGDFILIKEDSPLTNLRSIIRKSDIIEVVGE